MIRRASALWLLLFLMTPGTAQQVFVKNQPFEGKVVKEAGTLWVELAPLGWALGFDSKIEADGARVEGRLVRTLKQGEVVLVPLAQVAAAVGAVVKENPDFGTVDVHLTVRSRVGAGLEIDPSAGNSMEKAKGLQTAGYEFALTDALQASRDPRRIKAFLQAGGTPMDQDIRFDAIVGHKGDLEYKRGAAIFTWFTSDLPKELETESNQLAFQFRAVALLLDDLGMELVKAPEVVDNGGQRFVMAGGISKAPPHSGMLILLRIDAKKKRIYQVVTAGIPQTEEQATSNFLQLMTTVLTR